MQIHQNHRYRTRARAIVVADSFNGKNAWFPWKIRREDGTYYTVTAEGKRLWNVTSEEDLIEDLT